MEHSVLKRSVVQGLSFVLLLALAASEAPAREAPVAQRHNVAPLEDYRGAHRPSLDQDPSGFPATAPGDTYILASYSFDAGASCTAEGWVALDMTAQMGEFFHVAQYAGGVNNELNGGSFGRLLPLQGNKSLWCGAYANYPTNPPGVMCDYASLPGYGNHWNQAFRTKDCLSVLSGVAVTFLTTWDSEPGYEGTTIEVDECDDVWVPAGAVLLAGGHFEGIGVDSLHTHQIPDSLHSGSLRIRFHMTSDGAWSDEDGLWDTDGAILIDSLSVSDASGIVLTVEDFEDEAEGATSSDDWMNAPLPGYGDFSGLLQGFNLIQEDPCRSNLTCMWNFFTGSTFNYACRGFPGQLSVPMENAEGQFLNQAIRSPLIPWAGAGASAELEFVVYRDLPLDYLMFYTWSVASVVDGCTGPFRDRNWVYYGGQRDWFNAVHPFGDLVTPGATDIQIELGAVDMCPFWCGPFGYPSCHSHAPLLDEVVVRRIEADGPQWSVRDIDLFQDTFPDDGTITGVARADVANDIMPASILAIDPGDSVTVHVNDPDVGLATDPFTGFGPAVYAYVAVWPPNQPGKDGNALTQDSFRWPVVDSLQHVSSIQGLRGWPPLWDTSNTWYCLRMDTSFTDGTARTGAQPDIFCVDLNDNLFTAGDTICVVFAAQSASTGTRTYWSPMTGGTKSLQEALDAPDEFQILPGGGYNRGGDILYVDGFDGRGAQPHFESAFMAMGIHDEVDRFDIRAPSSMAGNHPGSRVKNVFAQIVAPYRTILWNTGDLSRGLIGDGTGNPEKSDDAYLLYTFLDQRSNWGGGLYLSGDDMADYLYHKSNPSMDFVNFRTYIQGTLLRGDGNANAQGFGVNPTGQGETGSCFDHILGPDEIVIYGGCPLINDFDVITPQGNAQLEMNYGGYPGQSRGAIISQVTNNSAGYDVGVMLSGFSFHNVQNSSLTGIMDHWHHLSDILYWLNQPNSVIPAHSPKSTNSLSQNYPNPFNPVTSITFTVRERTPVKLHVYNVAGQLIRTLVNDTRAPGIVHTIEWDGRNNAGQSVSSGVYFYRLVAKGFTETKKMVLLK